MNAFAYAAIASGFGALGTWGWAAARMDRLTPGAAESDAQLERAIVLFLVFSLFAVVFAGIGAVTS
jgi:hypothetical protein